MQPEQAKDDLQQPEPTYNEQEQMQNDNHTLRLFYNMKKSVLFSSMFYAQHHSNIASWRIMMEIEHQTYINYYHIYLLLDIVFAVYVANHCDTCKSTYARLKSTLQIKIDISITF